MRPENFQSLITYRMEQAGEALQDAGLLLDADELQSLFADVQTLVDGIRQYIAGHS